MTDGLPLDFESLIRRQLADHFDLRPDELSTISHDPADLVLKAVGRTLFIEVKRRGDDIASLARALDQLESYTQGGKAGTPLLVVPYMGEKGKALCASRKISWMDLSGNADIAVPGYRIKIQGEPNRFTHAGRPSTPFAPKSARITRWLLLHPDARPTQRELARATYMDEGFTSRIVQRLRADGHLTRDEDDRLVVTDRGRLLDAWREDAHFSSNKILRGHVYARSGEELIHRLADELRKKQLAYAATGLAAAWLMAPYADFRTVTIYLGAPPREDWLERIGFNPSPRGANTWLVIPADEGVFTGADEWQGVRCVSPLQVYVDLKDHPERAEDAAGELRRTLLGPSS